MTGQSATFATSWRRWPWLVDLAPLILEIPAVADLMGGEHHHDGGDKTAGPTSWIITQLLILPLIARRRHPIGVAVFLGLVGAVQCVVGAVSSADFALLVALYTVAAYRDRRSALIATGVLEAGVIIGSLRFAPVGDDWLASLVFLTAPVAAALFLGTTLQQRRDYLASLEDRAVRLERERDQQAELAATAERTRIAREMHDIVAHSLSVVITLADGAVAAAPGDPDGAAAAMTQVGETGRQALAEMRRLLGVLRDERPAELAPQPDLERLSALLDDVRGTGLPVRFTVTGAAQELPATAESTAYRIVQESLTNVLKHSYRPTEVSVRMTWRPGELALDITDDGVPAGGDGAPLVGHGLQGIRERVGMFDGELVAGPTSHGWRVSALLRFSTVTAS